MNLAVFVAMLRIASLCPIIDVNPSETFWHAGAVVYAEVADVEARRVQRHPYPAKALCYLVRSARPGISRRNSGRTQLLTHTQLKPARLRGSCQGRDGVGCCC